jgi:hypothetical protein
MWTVRWNLFHSVLIQYVCCLSTLVSYEVRKKLCYCLFGQAVNYIM